MDSLSSLFASPAARDALRGGDYGALLRLARQARGLTQAQAGQLAGYSAATISRFETGARRLADIETLRRLAAALNITPELFGLTPGIPGRTAAARPPRQAPHRSLQWSLPDHRTVTKCAGVNCSRA